MKPAEGCDRFTPEELARLDALAKAATPGPWSKGRSYASIIGPIAQDDPDRREDARHYGGKLVAESVFGGGDIAFIAEARTAVPELVEAAREGAKDRTALEVIARELTEALDGVLGTESDEPDFEEKWDRAEVVCRRAQEVFGMAKKDGASR